MTFNVFKQDVNGSRTDERIVTCTRDCSIIVCGCHMFEMEGLMCRHIIRFREVLGSNGNHLLMHIPKPLILQRYTLNWHTRDTFLIISYYIVTIFVIYTLLFSYTLYKISYRYCRTAKDGLLIADTIPEVSHPDVAQMSELITAMAKLKSTVLPVYIIINYEFGTLYIRKNLTCLKILLIRLMGIQARLLQLYNA